MSVLRRPEFLPARAYRWNFATMGLDYSLFSLGLSFVSTTAVLPLFVHHLTPSNVVIGLLPALQSVSGLPPLLVAGRVERQVRKKPFIMVWTTVERLPYLALAVLVPLLAAPHPALLLWIFLALLMASSLAGGITLPGWLDLIARMLPGDWRGRLFGYASALGGLLSIGGSAAAVALLSGFDWPGGFALCFGAAFVCLVASYLCLLVSREPVPEPVPVDARPPAAARRLWLPPALRADRNFGRYLVAGGLLAAAGATEAFYTVAAREWFGLTDAQAGLYAVPLLVATTVGSIAWGYLGDLRGHKTVLEGGALCTALGAILALLSHNPQWGPAAFVAVFVLAGLGVTALLLAALTMATDFAPDDLRPTYIGLASLVRAPFAVATPVGAGFLADRMGYPAVFALTLAVSIAGGLLVWHGVRDPRVTRGHGPSDHLEELARTRTMS